MLHIRKIEVKVSQSSSLSGVLLSNFARNKSRIENKTASESAA